MRKNPKQERSRVTLEAILDAATQVLAKGGRRAFTTNAIAARAGVSIGTLYQYVADKDALYLALAERMLRRDRATMAAALERAFAGELPRPAAVLVHEVIALYRVRPSVRRIVMAHLIGLGRGEDVGAAAQSVAEWLVDRALPGAAGGYRERVFVAVHGIEAAIRAMAYADPHGLASRAFENAIVAMATALLPELAAPAARSTRPGAPLPVRDLRAGRASPRAPRRARSAP